MEVGERAGRPRATDSYASNDMRIPPTVRRGAVAVAAPGILSLVVGGCVGWGSAALPPKLSEAERARIAGAHVPMTVGVERCDAPVYSESLRDALRRTGIFDRVDDLERFDEPPSLVARVERRVHGTAVVPLWTLLTFGIVPTSVEETAGWSFSLGAPERPGERVRIECVHTGRTTLGWIAVFEAADPDRTIVPFAPTDSARFRERLALAILVHQEPLRR